ncbi:LysR substrate-binding domain-containing protein [Pseudonocardia sp. HH130630-07]|uniref:LysR substrate-binding domain-containing protein n=1 Tax=Pseudonocardia sp. HH130630-07 TaxID=1690815 RepID=UPI000814D576|nr:LysR substrate-binding domain-containing protein [Pseudonocardia sp. HH130630-07]ANY07750.1 hypothetical protein AFB00_17255 [Pseudonocardia sp. HH130630-07]
MLVEPTTSDPLAMLRRGELDLVVVRLPFDEPDLAVGPELDRDGRVLAVARTDPLAAARSVSVEVLADRGVCRFPRYPESLHLPILPKATPSGRPIPVVLDVDGIWDVLEAVARGRIVHPTSARITDYYNHPDVVFVPLHDAPALCTALTWVSGAESAAARAFVAEAEREVEQCEGEERAAHRGGS